MLGITDFTSVCKVWKMMRQIVYKRNGFFYKIIENVPLIGKRNNVRMGLFKNMFGGSDTEKEEKVLPWIALKDKSQIEGITKASNHKTQLIFKHSTRCGISRMVMNQFVSAYDLTEEDADLYYLDLLNYREASAEVGYSFQVLHQSPQLIVVKNGNVVAHGSHGGVNELELSDYM